MPASRCRNLLQRTVHPFRRERQVPEQRPPIVGWQRTTESSYSFGRDVLRSEVTKRLDDEPRRPAGSRHVARCRASKLQRHRTDLDDTARTVGQKDHLRWHLLRKSEQVRRIGSRRLESDPVPPCHCLRERLWRGGEGAQAGVLLRVVVQATAELTDRAGFGLPPERRRDGRTAGEVQEVAWSEDPPLPMASDTVKYRLFRRLRVLGHELLKQKMP